MVAPALQMNGAAPPGVQAASEPGVTPQAIRCLRAARIIGLVAVAVAVAVLVAWPLDIPALRTVIPGGAAMKPLTALGFVLAGLSLWLQAQPFSVTRRRTALVSAALVASIGGVMLAEHALRLPARPHHPQRLRAAALPVGPPGLLRRHHRELVCARDS